MNTLQIDRSALPALTGSDKQIAWAEDIRANQMQAIERELLGFSKKLTETQTQAMVELVQSALGKCDSAKAWIDNKCVSVKGAIVTAYGSEAQAKINEVMAK